MKTESRKLLKELAIEIGVELSESQLVKFTAFGDLLIKWNERINLTALVDERDIIIKHFVDSLTIIKYFRRRLSDANEALKVVDVGAGAGFPGVPVKIVMEDMIDIVLIEAVGKKARFIEEVICELKLSEEPPSKTPVLLQNGEGGRGIKALCARAESVGRLPEYRGVADIVTARAVASLSVLLEYCTPLLKQDGVFLAMKSGQDAVDKEISDAKNAVDILGCVVEKADKFFLPQTDILRSIITIRKIRKTPDEFPRRVGKPSSKPL